MKGRMVVEEKKGIPEALKDDAMEQVAGGETVLILQPYELKRCAADPSHVYIGTLNACPRCGCKEFTF